MTGRKWEPKNDEQRAALAKVAAEAEQSRASVDRLWAAAHRASKLGVPRTHIAEASGISLPTVNRHLGTKGSSDERD